MAAFLGGEVELGEAGGPGEPDRLGPDVVGIGFARIGGEELDGDAFPVEGGLFQGTRAHRLEDVAPVLAEVEVEIVVVAEVGDEGKGLLVAHPSEPARGDDDAVGLVEVLVRDPGVELDFVLRAEGGFLGEGDDVDRAVSQGAVLGLVLDDLIGQNAGGHYAPDGGAGAQNCKGYAGDE